MDLTWSSIEAAHETLKRWRMKMSQWGSEKSMQLIPRLNQLLTPILILHVSSCDYVKLKKSDSDNKASIFRYADQVLGLDLNRPLGSQSSDTYK
jgi:cysteinyl-tRNA synthetase